MYDTFETDSTTLYRMALDYLSGFQFHGFRLGLERIDAILRALGEPQKRYPCIHVAGTNGKGSTCAFLESILTEAGFKVGLYTSPHLVRLEERFRVHKRFISSKALTRLILKIRKFVEAGYELSYFEYTTAISMLWFAEEGVDMAIFETGLGGRLDATNIVHPMVSVITNISLEHQAFLGKTIGQIAREKAGIIKDKGVVVTGARDPVAHSVIEMRAQQLGARLYCLGEDFRYEPRGHGKMDFEAQGQAMENLALGLTGQHQMENASLAIMTCMLLKDYFRLSVPQLALRRGLEKATWPGRGEFIKTAGQGTILLDGAHNLAGIKTLNALVAEHCRETRVSSMVLLWAMSDEGGDKDHQALLEEAAHGFHHIVLTEPPGPRRPVTIEDWKKAPLSSRAHIEKRWDLALAHALSLLERDSLLVVSGSLYLVGACRRWINEKLGITT